MSLIKKWGTGAVLLLAGCASVPQQPADYDQQLRWSNDRWGYVRSMSDTPAGLLLNAKELECFIMNFTDANGDLALPEDDYAYARLTNYAWESCMSPTISDPIGTAQALTNMRYSHRITAPTTIIIRERSGPIPVSPYWRD
jgi:hypothetical protein